MDSIHNQSDQVREQRREYVDFLVKICHAYYGWSEHQTVETVRRRFPSLWTTSTGIFAHEAPWFYFADFLIVEALGKGATRDQKIEFVEEIDSTFQKLLAAAEQYTELDYSLAAKEVGRVVSGWTGKES